MNDYKQWEADCERIRKENKVFLNEFQTWLEQAGLKTKTAKKHIGNVDFYINSFLLYDDITLAKDGASHIDMFLSSWFIRKASWASPASLKSNAASLKKFYTFLLGKGDIDKATLADLKSKIKEKMPAWTTLAQRTEQTYLKKFYFTRDSTPKILFQTTFHFFNHRIKIKL